MTPTVSLTDVSSRACENAAKKYAADKSAFEDLERKAKNGGGGEH
jgi:hypothetical protein